MADILKILALMQRYAKGVLFKVCDHYFGEARQRGTCHRIYKTPWQGDPRVNIQRSKGKTKAYHIRQILAAIAKLEKHDE